MIKISTDESDTVRLDKWLWAARFFKTRSVSQENIELGRVRMNGTRLKPGKVVRVGDVLEITRGSEQFVVKVTALSGTRGSATVAAGLYEETAESIAKRALVKENSKLIPVPYETHKGRPTKRDGRRIRSFIDSFNPSKEF